MQSTLPETVAAQPCVYLWKDVIRVGRYRHPGRGFAIHVDRKRLDHWARNFSRMNANGVRVHIPADHSDAAADNRGYVLRLKRVGDRLMALCQFIGADAARDASRNEVSIGVAPTFIDGKGRTYRDAIVHVALTPVPVVPGQGRFMAAETFSAPVADATAAAGAAPAGVLSLAQGKPYAAAANFTRRANMAQIMLPCSEETLSALHDAVPGLSDVPDEGKLDQILQYIQSAAADSDQANLRLAEANNKLSMRDKRIEELSLAMAAPAPDPAVGRALLEAVKAKRDLCVSRGALTPVVADALLAHLAPDNQLIGLSRANGGGVDATLALSIFSALADNRPIASGERTGPQGRALHALGRSVPGEGRPQGPPLYEKMAAMADGKRVEL
jgi:hypothetical protein